MGVKGLGSTRMNMLTAFQLTSLYIDTHEVKSEVLLFSHICDLE